MALEKKEIEDLLTVVKKEINKGFHECVLPQINAIKKEVERNSIDLKLHIKDDEDFQGRIANHMTDSKSDTREVLDILKGNDYEQGLVKDVKDMRLFYQRGKAAVWFITIGGALGGFFEGIKAFVHKG